MNFDKFKVVDNFIPKFYQEELKNMVFNHEFPWFYIKDVTFGAYSKHTNTNPALTHAFKEDEVESKYFKLVENIGLEGIKQSQSTYSKILLARSFLQFPLAIAFKKQDVDYLHVDIYQPHLVVLYYVNDSDGDTILTDHAYNDIEGPQFNLEAKNFNVIASVAPKQGRALLFDGRYYHTGTQSNDSVRCIINMDIG